ncbi:MAG: DHA2 family efflux MFS transporter permease subunit [Acidobacteria bacterium]|nr:DHA2 family efflux MFS transporter permease subunit [Acidobacteriota bacterium]
MTITDRRTDSSPGEMPEHRTTPRTGNPWVPTAVVIVGSIIVILDTSIVNVALHRIGTALHAGVGDRFGRKTIYLGALAAFTAASALCALSPTLPFLVGARLLQGLGGGAVLPTGMAIVLDRFPRSQHGRAVAMWGMSAMVAPALGPTAGGWVVTVVSWHWLFLINVPIGVVCIAAGLRLLPDNVIQVRRSFDGGGLVLGSGGLALTVLGLSEGNQWGWHSIATVACVTIGLAGMALFIRQELNTAHPLIELRMFADRAFRLSMIVMFLVTFAQFGRLVFLSLELATVRGYTPLRIGLFFLPAAVATAGSMQVGGRLVDRLGPRKPIMLGCSVMFAALIGLGTLSVSTSEAMIMALLCIQGVGMGLINAPAMVAGLSELPAHLLGQGTAVRALCSQVSGAFAVASLGAVVAARSGVHPSAGHLQAAYNMAFLAAAGGLALALVLAARLPRGLPAFDLDVDVEALALAGE